ncbi:MAG TPA: porin [Burkholderiales bacterium]
MKKSFKRAGGGLPLLVAAALANAGAVWAQSDSDEKIKQLEEGIQKLTRELEDVKGQVQDTRDRAAQTEQRLDSQGVQARFNEGVTFEDPRGNWAVRVSGRAQLDYRHYEQDDVLANNFSMRRIRLGAGVQLYKDYTVYVEGDFASGDPAGTTQQQMRATLAYIDINWWKAARLRLGQFKPQIGLEQTLLDLQSDYMERGLQQNILDGNGINYDRGIMVSGAPLTGFYYAAMVSNGTGQNLEEKQGNVQEANSDGKDVTLRGVLDFAKILSLDDAIFHVGAGYKWGEQTNSSTSPFSAPVARTEARGITFFNPAAFNAAGRSVSNIDRSIAAAEMLMAYRSVKLQGEYWLAEYQGTRYVPGPVVEFSPQIKAGYLTAMWLITGENYSDAYRDSIPQKIKPRNKFGWGEGAGWGAWEVGLRYSFFDASDFNSSNPVSTGQLGAGSATVTPVVTTSTNKATAYTAQVKWIHNVYTRALLDYVHTEFDTPVVANGQSLDHEDAIMMRFQVDF